MLGLWLAHEHPELIYAYVGTGQVVNMEQNDTTAYQDALEEGRKRNNAAAVKELESLAPFSPMNAGFEKASIARNWEAELLGPPPADVRFEDIGRILRDLVSAPDYSLFDDYAFIRGQALSGEMFFPQLAKVKLNELGMDFRTPVFFFEGRRDPFCRSSLIWEYSQTIQAPQKGFVWFENSGHFPFFDAPEKFKEELVRRVMPLALSHPSGG